VQGPIFFAIYEMSSRRSAIKRFSLAPLPTGVNASTKAISKDEAAWEAYLRARGKCRALASIRSDPDQADFDGLLSLACQLEDEILLACQERRMSGRICQAHLVQNFPAPRVCSGLGSETPSLRSPLRPPPLTAQEVLREGQVGEATADVLLDSLTISNLDPCWENDEDLRSLEVVAQLWCPYALPRGLEVKFDFHHRTRCYETEFSASAKWRRLPAPAPASGEWSAPCWLMLHAYVARCAGRRGTRSWGAEAPSPTACRCI
jgi:hypothetical protein